MQGFLEFVVKGLVRHPDEVAITPVESNGSTIYELRLNADDVGRVIGRDGATINAIRSLLTAGSARRGLRCSLEIVEEGDEYADGGGDGGDGGDRGPAPEGGRGDGGRRRDRR